MGKPVPIPDIIGCKYQGRDFPISELRIVRIYIRTPLMRQNGSHDPPSDHFMHKDQVDTFVAASIALHQTKGNPHTKNGPPDQLWEIRVHSFKVDTNSYWWCTMDLKKNDDPNGAQLNQTCLGERVWAHPELLAQERRAEEMED